jgi:LPXTG-site transpeptidase (sortase) family protein
VREQRAASGRAGAPRWARRLILLGALLLLAAVGVVVYNLWPETTTLPEGRRLVVPKIGVDVRVYEGDADTALDLGVYRYPQTGVPGEAANMAVAGHRMAERFALLHVLKRGDEVIVYWDGVEHDYRVESVGEVTAQDDSILARGRTERLTLYTCTPRWLGDRRTVIVALPAS